LTNYPRSNTKEIGIVFCKNIKNKLEFAENEGNYSWNEFINNNSDNIYINSSDNNN